MPKTKKKLLETTAPHREVELAESEDSSAAQPVETRAEPKSAPRKITLPRTSPASQAFPRGPPVEALAFSIKHFCAAHGISIWTYFRMQQEGTGPKVMKVRGRTLISIEAAAAWRREREAASQLA